MDGEAIFKAFRDIFPTWGVKKYKRLDPHSIEIVAENKVMTTTYIFTFYNLKSFKLETK